LSFNMGWWILQNVVFYPEPGARDTIYW
jgi:hypothetical protein